MRPFWLATSQQRSSMLNIEVKSLLLILPLLFCSGPSLAASFDCGKARSTMEKLICSDEKLSRLDEDLNVAFRQAVTVSGAGSLVTQWQRQWLRSYAVTSCKDVPCLQTAFADRVELLRSVAPSSEASSRWTGRYVRFWKDKEDRNTAELLLIGLWRERIYVSGSALWMGPNAAQGQVNTGEMEGVGRVGPYKTVFDLDGCHADMVLKGERVVVEQEAGCGGMNVSFVREYRKK